MNRIIRISFLLFTLFCALSCVNKEYDLSNGVDKSIDIKGEIKLPLGGSELITLGDFLELDGASALQTDNQGKYFFEINQSDAPTEVSFTMKPISIPEKMMAFNSIDISLGGFAPGSVIPDIIEDGIYSGVCPIGGELSFGLNIPEEVSGIKKATLNSTLLFELSSSQNTKYEVEAGTYFKFPEGITISYTDPGDQSTWKIDYDTIEGNYKLEFIDNIRINGGSDNKLTFRVNVSEIDFEKLEEGINDGEMNIPIELEGSLKYLIRASDYNIVPERIALLPALAISESNLQNIELKLNFDKISDFKFEAQDFNLYDQIPDFFKNDNIKLDLYNPYIQLHTESTLPFDCGLGMKLNAKNEQGDITESLEIANDKIVFKSGEMADYYISKRGGVAPEGAIDVEADFNKLIKDVPHQISLEDISFNWPTDYFTLDMSKSLSASMAYAINIPLSLGKDFILSYDYTIDGLDISSLTNNPDFNIELSELELKFEIENNIAMGLEIAAVAIDKNGNEMSASDIEISGGIAVTPAKNGTASVSQGSIKISIKSEDAIEKFNGLILTITGKGSEEVEGQQLASTQGFRFNNMSIGLICGK